MTDPINYQRESIAREHLNLEPVRLPMSLSTRYRYDHERIAFERCRGADCTRRANGQPVHGRTNAIATAPAADAAAARIGARGRCAEPYWLPCSPQPWRMTRDMLGGLGSLNGWRLGTRADIRGGHYRGTVRYQLGSRRCCNPHVFWIAEKSEAGTFTARLR